MTETEAFFERQRSGRFHDVDELLKTALDSLDEPVQTVAPDASPGGPKNLFELFAPVRGLLTDDEIDTLFARNRSGSRPVDLS
jgi:hypothetical protein